MHYFLLRFGPYTLDCVYASPAVVLRVATLYVSFFLCVYNVFILTEMSVTGIRRRSQAERTIHDAAVKAVSTDVPKRRRGRAAQPKRSLKQRLVDWVDLPDFLKDNE
jgi:hypothetical protein